MGPMGGRSDQKAKNFSQTAKRMIKDFKNEKVLIIIVIVLSILSAVFTICAPLFLQDFLQNIMKVNEGGILSVVPSETIGIIVKINWPKFFSKFGLLLGFYVISALLMWLAEFISVSISNSYAYRMRDNIKKKLDKMPLSYFDRVPYGDTLSIGTNDVDNVARNLQSIIVNTFNSITLFLGTIIAMLVSMWQLSLVAFCSLPFTILVVILIAKFSQKQFLTYRKSLGELNGKVEESYAGYLVIKLFNKQQDFIDDFNKTNEEMAKADKLSQFLSGLIFPLTNFINNLAYVGIAVVGGLLNNPSQMITFFIFLNLFSRPFQQIGQIINIIQSVVASGERIFALLDEEEFVPYSTNAIQTNDNALGKFEFDNVYFSYVEDKPLIEDFNLKVNPGETVAIVGPTGAGKTTIVNLIMRFYEINSGSIKLDDIDTRDYTRNCLRGNIGMVLQDTWLFRGTIKENLLYGDQNATMDDLISACKETHIYHFIETLPGGFDFILNEDGTNISQGQRQLLTIARAIISKPKILILDEATSSVDTRTEKQIQDALDTIMKNKTSFVIAHRLSTIKNAKLIIVMQKGHIVETGNHAELLAKNGFYADLYNSQFSGIIKE